MSDARRHALTVQLYTEDSRDAKRACATLEELVRGILTLVEPALELDRIAFRPLHETPGQRVSGSFWKAGKDAKPAARDKRRSLILSIATELRRGHVVVFHVDGDDRYLRDGSHAEVWAHLERLQSDVTRLAPPKGTPLKHVFLPVVPFYSIESWAYANITLLLDTLTTAQDLAHLAAWMADPGAREDILKIKDTTLSICDDMNEELVRVARGFPREELLALKKSYADTHASFAASPVIAASLRDAAARPH